MLAGLLDVFLWSLSHIVLYNESHPIEAFGCKQQHCPVLEFVLKFARDVQLGLFLSMEHLLYAAIQSKTGSYMELNNVMHSQVYGLCKGIKDVHDSVSLDLTLSLAAGFTVVHLGSYCKILSTH